MNLVSRHGIEHVGFLVRDMQQVAEHMKTVIPGIQFQFYDYKPLRAWSYGRLTDKYHLKIAMGTIPHHDTGIEIIQWVSGEGIHRDFVGNGTGGMHHIAFRVEDYDYWRGKCANNEKPFIFEAEAEDPVNGYRRCFYAWDDIAGMVYEIKEVPHFR